MPLSYSPIYGGTPSTGDVASPTTFDCVLSIGGDGQQWQIDQIVALYGMVLDYEQSLRSFTGRLLIIEGQKIINQISVGGPPNPFLIQSLSNFGTVKFDKLLNDYKKHVFKFDSTMRSQPGTFLNVILLASSAYDNAGVAMGIGVPMLYVNKHPIPIDRNRQIPGTPFHEVG